MPESQSAKREGLAPEVWVVGLIAVIGQTLNHWLKLAGQAQPSVSGPGGSAAGLSG